MSDNDLKKNYDYVIKNKAELLKNHKNKYILVFNKEVVNSFDTYEAAAAEGIRRFSFEGDFLVYFLSQSEPVNFIFCRA